MDSAAETAGGRRGWGVSSALGILDLLCEGFTKQVILPALTLEVRVKTHLKAVILTSTATPGPKCELSARNSEW